MIRSSHGWLKAAWPVLLCAMTAAATLACVRLIGSGPRPEASSRIDVPSTKPFDQVRVALEGALQPARFTVFGPAGVAGAAPSEVARRLDALSDKEGLMILAESDVGPRQSQLLGKAVRSKAYLMATRSSPRA
jgi:hypothetical protein